MITLSVSAEPDSSYLPLHSDGVGWMGGVSSSIRPLLLCYSEKPEGTLYHYNLGKIVTGVKVYGHLRDRACLHATAHGEVDLVANTIKKGVGSDGMPYAQLPGGTLVPYREVVYFGEDVDQVHTLIEDPRWYQGDLYSRSAPTQVRHIIKWLSLTDFVTVREMHTFDGLKNGNLWITASYYTTYTVYTVIGDAVFRAANFVAYSRYTEEELDAYYSFGFPWPTGAEMQPYRDFLRTVHSDIEGLADDYLKHVESVIPYNSISFEHPVDFGDLSLECAKQLKFVDNNILLIVLDVNDWRQFHKLWKNFANLRGWKEAKKAFDRISGGSGKLTDLVEMFKPASSTYLFDKYAVQPSSADVGRLSKGLRDWAQKLGGGGLYPQRLHTRKITPLSCPTGYTSHLHTAVMTVECASYPDGMLGKLQEFIGGAKKFGLWPACTNLYDLIPYSFVLDWFLPFGDFLQDTDNFLDTKNYFPISHVIMSEKYELGVESTVIAPTFPVTGRITITFYDRWVTTELPLPNVSFDEGSGLGTHLVEASALVLQRL